MTSTGAGPSRYLGSSGRGPGRADHELQRYLRSSPDISNSLFSLCMHGVFICRPSSSLVAATAATRPAPPSTRCSSQSAAGSTALPAQSPSGCRAWAHYCRAIDGHWVPAAHSRYTSCSHFVYSHKLYLHTLLPTISISLFQPVSPLPTVH